MKKLLILYVLFSILAGCSTKQSPVEKHKSNVGHDDVELTKKTTPQKPELKYGCEVTSLAMVLQNE